MHSLIQPSLYGVIYEQLDMSLRFMVVRTASLRSGVIHAAFTHL